MKVRKKINFSLRLLEIYHLIFMMCVAKNSRATKATAKSRKI